MNLSIGTALFTLVIFQLAFLCCFLFTYSKGRRVSNRLLGFFFLALGLNLLDLFLLYTGVYFRYPVFAGFGNCMLLLSGPLLYFYTKSVIYKNFTLSWRSALHFFPFSFLFLLSELFYITQPRPVQIALLQRLAVHRVPEQFVFSSTLIFLQFMCYMVLALRLIVSYKKEANQHFSSPRRTDVSWLYSTVIFFMVVIVSSGANGWLTQTPLTQYYLLFFNIMILALLIFVLRTLMGTLRGSHLLLTEENYKRGKNTLLFKNNETENDAKEQAAQSLLAYMKASKPFLEPDLTLDELAAQLSFKSKFLSQVINERLQQNFFDLINRYRIEEAARMLTNPRDKKITILEVLYKVGFNSKSSFNTLFKKYTGMTPTEFKKNQSSIKEL